MLFSARKYVDKMGEADFNLKGNGLIQATFGKTDDFFKDMEKEFQKRDKKQSNNNDMNDEDNLDEKQEVTQKNNDQNME